LIGNDGRNRHEPPGTHMLFDPLRLATRIRRRHSQGQALVELAIVIPVMLFLLLGALDLGRLFYAKITVANAAKEGAFVAASGKGTFSAGACSTSNTVMCAATSEATGGFVTVSSANVTASVCPANATFGSTASVTVKASFHAITPFIGAMLGGQDILLGATANAQCAVFPVAADNTPSSGNCTIPDLTPNTDPGPPIVTTTVPKSQAAALWSEAGFTGTVTPIGDATDWTIVAQSPASGGSAACTSGVTIYQSAVAMCSVPKFVGENSNGTSQQNSIRTTWTNAGFTAANLSFTGSGNKVTAQSIGQSPPTVACSSSIVLTQ
jgi:Flp pilus assembly protein TadG